MNTRDPFQKDLVALLCEISDTKEMNAVLEALLTGKELEEIARRVQIFRLLAEPMTQREVAARLGVGIATVTRGAHAIKSAGATAILDHLPANREAQ